MNNRPKYILTFLAISLLSFSAKGQSTPASLETRIDSIVTRYMIMNRMVGVSIGIVMDGKILLTKGYGTREIGKVKPVDSLTNFLTCSITKLFTATAIMQLAEQGQIDIHQKLVHYLPDFRMRDDRYTDITIEQMMTHTSGLYWDIELRHSPNDSSALRKLVYSLHDKVLAFVPGTKFNGAETYSNAAYDILGYLVQKISGQSYMDYIADHILAKADMPHSSIDLHAIPKERRSTPHILKGETVKVGGMYTENTEHAPSGNLNSCALDLCHWMISQLNTYRNPEVYNGILHHSSLQDMWTTRFVAPQNEKVSIGLGWWITESEELGKYVWHVGNNPGFSATLMVFPEHNFGITVLTNGQYKEQVVWNSIPFDIIKVFKLAFGEE